MPAMTEVTRILRAMDQGDRQAAAQLLPIVYDELRKLAAQKLAHEKPGQTLQAYLRLVESERRGSSPPWTGRGHFFAAAAEAMRRILVNRARDKKRLKRGGGRKRLDLDRLAVVDDATDDDLLALDEALQQLARENKPCAELVQLRFFAGLTLDEAARSLGLARRTADRYWAFARAWLYQALTKDAGPPPE